MASDSPPPPQPHPNNPQKPTLQTLPLDILFHLATTTALDYPSLLALSCTSRALRAAIHPDTLCPRPLKLAFFRRAEHFPQHAGKLACFACFRILRADRFGASQRNGRGGKFGEDVRRVEARFCWECGVRGRRYVHLRGVRRGLVGRGKGEELWYPCHRCGVARRARERCLREVCVVDGEPLGGDSRLERLPRAVLERVLAGLGYGDLIALGRASRTLKGAVGEPGRRAGDVYGKWEFVVARMKALGWWSRLGAPRACFGCFRPRTSKQFSENQYFLWRYEGTAMSNYWRRRCWECLRRFYHPQLADTEARDRFHRQVVCEVCKSLRYRNEDCRGCFVHRIDIARWAMLKREKMAARARSSGCGEETIIPLEWFDVDVAAAAEPTGDSIVEESDLPLQWFNEEGPGVEESEVDEPCEEAALLLQWLYEDEPGAPTSLEPESDDAGEGDSSGEGGSPVASGWDVMLANAWEPASEEVGTSLAFDQASSLETPVVSAY